MIVPQYGSSKITVFVWDKIIMARSTLSEDQRQALNIVREGHNLFITGQGGTARKNNGLLSSIFSAA